MNSLKYKINQTNNLKNNLNNLNNEWIKCYDEQTNLYYYYNNVSGIS